MPLGLNFYFAFNVCNAVKLGMMGLRLSVQLGCFLEKIFPLSVSVSRGEEIFLPSCSVE